MYRILSNIAISSSMLSTLVAPAMSGTPKRCGYQPNTSRMGLHQEEPAKRTVDVEAFLFVIRMKNEILSIV